MTKLTKQVLIALFALFVIQAITRTSLPWTRLVWTPNPEAFQAWQPFTHWFYQDIDGVINTLLTWLMVFFFVPPTEESYGRRGVLRITLTIMISCALIGTIGVLSGSFRVGQAAGIMPLVTAFITLFGLNRPNASILLFFVLPIKAIWIAWGTGLLTLMYYIASISGGGSLPAALSLTAWCTAYGWVKLVDEGRLRKALLRRKQRQLQKRLRTFDILEGGGQTSEPRGWGHDPNQGDDGPIVH